MKQLKYIYRAYRYKYLIDPPEIKFIQQHLRKGDVAIDIGSHKGGYLYWMHKMVGQDGFVYGFEPQPKLFNYLKETLVGEAYQNVILENKGVSNQEGKVNFHIPITAKGTSPGAKIGHFEDGTANQKVEIEVVTLDNHFYYDRIYPNLIKIDVEGHEKEVLQGGIELLKKCKPALVIECENRHLPDSDVLDVFSVLFEIGYKGYFFENGSMQPINKFDATVHQKVGEGSFWEAKGYINNFIFTCP